VGRSGLWTIAILCSTLLSEQGAQGETAILDGSLHSRARSAAKWNKDGHNSADRDGLEALEHVCPSRLIVPVPGAVRVRARKPHSGLSDGSNVVAKSC
jgi:hypothetical protein